MKTIPEYRLELRNMDGSPVTTKRFKWASPEIGNRSKIGGNPDPLCGERPGCPSCKKEMSFYAQIDSLDDANVIGDCGMLFVFFCFDCGQVETIVRSH